MIILVTGGLGFIGSNFVNYILENTVHEVVNVDKCDYQAREHNAPEHPRYTYIRGDITEQYHMRHIFRTHQPDVVIHYAAQSCVTKSFDRAFHYTQDNVLGTHVLLETAKNYGKLKKFIHISTDEVYGEIGANEISCENSPLNPSNPYSASKAASELYVRAYANAYKLPCIITRGNNVFGPRQYPEKVVPLFVTQIMNKNSATIHGDGSTRRNFIHVDDVSRAVELVLVKGEIGKTYNIGSRYEYSVLEMFNKIQAIMGKGEAEFIKDPRPFNDSRYCIDSSELRKLGWAEDPNFDLKLRETVEWYTQNPEWYSIDDLV